MGGLEDASLSKTEHSCEGSQTCVKLRDVAGIARVGIGRGGSRAKEQDSCVGV